MKHLALFCIFMLFVHYSVQVPKYENCLSDVLPAGERQRCIQVTCSSGNRYKIKECSCDQEAALHLGERHSEYPACCPPCNRNRH